MIDEKIDLTILRQSELLCVSKSSHYYKHIFTEYELETMGKIDEIYTEHPYYWTRRISKELQSMWYNIGRKKARKYMWIMGIVAIYPKPKTSIANKEHQKFPYLLKDLVIERPNQVRSTDITYIKIPWWFVYLVAIIDWYSRYIISRDIGTTMDKELCIWVLKKALSKATPEIFNSDQWSQFTSNDFIRVLQEKDIQISMDGKWRCYDNIIVERLWRTIKYEDIHINEYQTPTEVYHGLSLYIEKYNKRRIHSSLDYKTPEQVYKN